MASRLQVDKFYSLCYDASLTYRSPGHERRRPKLPPHDRFCEAASVAALPGFFLDDHELAFQRPADHRSHHPVRGHHSRRKADRGPARGQDAAVLFRRPLPRELAAASGTFELPYSLDHPPFFRETFFRIPAILRDERREPARRARSQEPRVR